MNDNKDSNSKSLKKKILFCGLVLKPILSPHIHEKDLLKEFPSKLYEQFNLFKDNSFKQNNISVDILNCDTEHAFGCIHKITDFNNILADIKLKSNNEEINPDEIFLDHYTYFYIDFNSQKMCYINSQNISNPPRILEQLLSHDSTMNVSIIRVKKKIEEIKSSNGFYLNFTLLDPDKDFIPIEQLSNVNYEIVQAETKIKFYEGPSKLRHILEPLKEALLPSAKNISIFTDEENFDVLEETFTRSAYIEINSDYRINQEQIESTLKKELSRAIGT